MVNVENTKIAFESRSNSELNKIILLFKLVGYPELVNTGQFFLNMALALKLPVKWLLKPTIFRQFCGGETLEECMETAAYLEKQGVHTYPAYSIEAKKGHENFRMILDETVRTIEAAAQSSSIPFAVFKPTAFVAVDVLEKLNSGAALSVDEKKEIRLYEERFDTLCKTAYENHVPVLVDAEESWYQDAIDDLTMRMMERYNRDRAIVYNTFQMYRQDRLDILEKAYQRAREKGFHLGIKLVRGAYMEKERAYAAKKGQPCAIHKNKTDTDAAYNKALKFCAAHLERLALVCATHNEDSALLMTELMKEHNTPKNDRRVYFGQLFGMSDHLSFNLAHAGYNVVKYVPYGPVKEVIPYLIRRARENTSVAGQSSRELQLLLKEKNRRRQTMRRT